jgi:hypothetical protein
MRRIVAALVLTTALGLSAQVPAASAGDVFGLGGFAGASGLGGFGNGFGGGLGIPALQCQVGGAANGLLNGNGLAHGFPGLGGLPGVGGLGGFPGIGIPGLTNCTLVLVSPTGGVTVLNGGLNGVNGVHGFGPFGLNGLNGLNGLGPVGLNGAFPGIGGIPGLNGRSCTNQGAFIVCQ